MPQHKEEAGLKISGASISLGGVQKDYGSNTVLHDIDLDIAPGEFMTLLGPSGSGKTTTLGLIAGFTDPTYGTLEVNGTDVRPIPMHKRDIGVVFQNYALFPHMSVAENVAFPLKQRKVKGTDMRRQVAEALETVRMSGLEDRYPAQLSGGQQQRVALARSIVFRPRVLLMDEPLGALDKKLRDWLQLEIRRIHAEVGSTFVYVTHDQDEALSLSDRIAVFNHGRIEQVGTPEELYASPSTLFVGQFIGESTTFTGTFTQLSDEVCAVQGEEQWRAPHSRQMKPGAQAALLVRPEHIRLLPRSAPEAASNVNRARVIVEDLIYLGTGYRCKFRLADGTEGVCRLASYDGRSIDAGAESLIEWDITDGVVLNAEEN